MSRREVSEQSDSEEGMSGRDEAFEKVQELIVVEGTKVMKDRLERRLVECMLEMEVEPELLLALESEGSRERVCLFDIGLRDCERGEGYVLQMAILAGGRRERVDFRLVDWQMSDGREVVLMEVVDEGFLDGEQVPVKVGGDSFKEYRFFEDPLCFAERARRWKQVYSREGWSKGDTFRDEFVQFAERWLGITN